MNSQHTVRWLACPAVLTSGCHHGAVPEGDTVWLAGKRLRTALVGQRLLRGELRHPELSTVDLTGRAVIAVASVGKHLLTRFDDETTLHTHFRMDGSWHLYSPGTRWHGPDHQVRAVLATESRVAVGFRLHQMRLLPTAHEPHLLGHLGPDLLDEHWDAARQAEAVRRLGADPHRELAQALLDQRVMAGVGNLYKNEVCYLLGVTPWTSVSSVDPVQCVQLCRKLLLDNANHPHQSTTGVLGRGREHWVFERAGQRCRRCGTTVQTATQGHGTHQRISYLCPTCQAGPHPPLSVARSRPARPTPG